MDSKKICVKRFALASRIKFTFFSSITIIYSKNIIIILHVLTIFIQRNTINNKFSWCDSECDEYSIIIFSVCMNQLSWQRFQNVHIIIIYGWITVPIHAKPLGNVMYSNSKYSPWSGYCGDAACTSMITIMCSANWGIKNCIWN